MENVLNSNGETMSINDDHFENAVVNVENIEVCFISLHKSNN